MPDRVVQLTPAEEHVLARYGFATIVRDAEPQPTFDGDFWEWVDAGWSSRIDRITPVRNHSLALGCPFGQKGDALVVAREGRPALRAKVGPVWFARDGATWRWEVIVRLEDFGDAEACR